MTNLEIVKKLQEYVRILRQRQEMLYRIRAYQRAAETVQRQTQSIENLLHERGRNALEELPGIGRHLAQTIATFVQTGEWHARH